MNEKKQSQFIISTDYSGCDMILCHENGIPVRMGEKVGEHGVVIEGGRAPHKPSSKGFVWIKKSDHYVTTEYYPSVFKMEWVSLLGKMQ